MTYSITDIQRIIGAQWLQKAWPDAPVEQLLLDSRQITAAGAALFFALPGQRHDGHRYLPDAYRSGVRQFVVSQSIELQGLPQANILQVPDTLVALQALAAAHRAQFRIPVVGIGGSNGKTIVKEWLYQILAPDFNIVRSPKSYNSQVGVPLTVWQLQPAHTLALFEAGISQPGEMARLAKIIQPTIGIFTTIGPAHREGFSSKLEKLAEKMRLFDTAEVLLYCADAIEITAAAQKWAATTIPAGQGPRRTLSWSKTGQPADLQINNIEIQPDGFTQISIAHSSSIIPPSFRIPFQDAASIENAIHCWVVAHWLGTPVEQIAARMEQLEPVEMRLEMKSAIRHSTLINDAYNNDLASLRIALTFAAQQARGRRLTLIFSDILQSGRNTEKLYREVAGLILDQQVGRLIGIGTEVVQLRGQLPPNFDSTFYPTTTSFLEHITAHIFQDELILLKGARPFAFEQIARRLEHKAHQTRLEVNLTAIVHNLNVYNRLLRPGVKMMVMVKAAGYGSGAAEVAKLLEFHQVDYLGVAYADEGIELRQAGVKLPILVLNPEPATFDALYRHRLEPEVYSLAQLDELIRFAEPGKSLAIHLKLDTGMHRLGFEPQDVPLLVERLQAHPQLRVQSVFSHLAASDAAVHDAFTQQQATAFSTMYADIQTALGYAPLRHLVNTGGIHRWPDLHFDMVRLGIGLYGIDSSGLQDQLRVVNTL
ncbi:MAG: bifunctional UDP-N-acetylmuramoyl-tripeptide:D-alanyl-D-alanine ligase/alanine racemase, partial [Saprospiraceae bacterium]|nr:bifunctional UDP-N-acetylmuramoyl-tripeptide:D-alanyl-D-alanine ligase/alanine racemase [Saprospiraceae bacterium]